jgi:hypothetical protein
MVSLVLGLALATHLSAQAPEGRIVGVVHDQSGAVIPQATITVINEGTNAKFAAKSGPEGGFSVPSLSAGSYKVEITAAGFRRATYNNVAVLPAREYSLTATLTIGQASENVEVIAGQEMVNTTSAELVKSITTDQVKNLPLNGHDINGLITIQPGANTSARTGNTIINGARPSWTQVTVEGINIQDPFIRDNALDYLPNRPSTENVSEFSMSTSTQGAEAASASSSSIRMVMPSGTNTFHGKVFWYNRNSALAANEWFNNHSGVKRPPLNRNDFGANLAGPIFKNKLFFFGFYEGRRQRSGQQRNATIPANDDYLQGQFRYVRPSDNTVQSVNIINVLSGVSLDPKIQQLLSTEPKASSVNNYQTGNSKSGLLLNTAGFQQNQSYNNDRNAIGTKIVYDLNVKNQISGVFQQIHELTLRPSYDPVNIVSAITNDSTPRLFTGAWRYTASNNLVNNVRFGANLVRAPFASSYKNTMGWLPAASSVSSNVATMSSIGVAPTQVLFQPQGRYSRVWQFLDDVSYVKGSHTFTFGGSWQTSRVQAFNSAGLIPTYTFTFGAAAPKNIQLTAANFPGSSISSTDLSNANNLRAFLGGVISGDSQTFEVKDKTSGYIAGQQNLRNYRYDDTSMYFSDKWRLLPNLTITAGLKWEYFTPLSEQNGLLTGPVFTGLGTADLMSPNLTIDFLKNNRSYNPDRMNFAPALGFAWDPFKNGKMSVRGGYTMTYVDDNMITFATNAASVGNAGVETIVTQTGLYNPLSGGAPNIPTPTFKMPRTLADQLAVSSTGAVWALDPKAKTPMAHLVTLGVERELFKQSSVSVFYVGTFGRRMLRGLDLNQNTATSNKAFLDDFNRARNNGYLAQAQTGIFNPAYDNSVTGSQPLTYLPNITALNGYLTYSTLVSYMQQNQAASYADFLVQNRAVFTNSKDLFLPNPSIYVVDWGTNGSSSNYNSLQIEAKKRTSAGLTAQGSYVWSKLLADSQNIQSRFDPLLDNARPGLARARGDYDMRHSVKGSVSYDLPFGHNKAFLSGANGVADKVIGGWAMSTMFTWTSGNPFSIRSDRGTFNRGGRTTGHQGAVSSLSQDYVKKLLGVRQSANGAMYYIDPKVTDPNTGKAVGPDNQNNTASTNFNQVFSNPTAGNIGSLGIFAFDGPSYSNIDFSLQKQTRVTERVNTSFRFEMFNMLNHASFYYGDDEINGTSFGKMVSTQSNARQVQASLQLTF